MLVVHSDVWNHRIIYGFVLCVCVCVCVSCDMSREELDCSGRVFMLRVRCGQEVCLHGESNVSPAHALEIPLGIHTPGGLFQTSCFVFQPFLSQIVWLTKASACVPKHAHDPPCTLKTPLARSRPAKQQSNQRPDRGIKGHGNGLWKGAMAVTESWMSIENKEPSLTHPRSPHSPKEPNGFAFPASSCKACLW